MSEVHVKPRGDLVEHEDSEDCACRPTAEPLNREENGDINWAYLHRRLTP